MKIESGKMYRSVDGMRIGPMEHQDGHFRSGGCHYSDDGRYAYSGVIPRSSSDERAGTERRDIIAEWVDSPIRTATRKEIVPGIYGKVIVGGHLTPGWIDIRWGAPGITAPELRAAAATLNEIADALEEKPDA